MSSCSTCSTVPKQPQFFSCHFDNTGVDIKVTFESIRNGVVSLDILLKIRENQATSASTPHLTFSKINLKGLTGCIRSSHNEMGVF